MFIGLVVPLLLLFAFPAIAVVLPSNLLLQRLSPAESSQLASECGHSTELVANGRQHPWAVSFMTKGRNKLGGTIISPFHVLTVAHGFLRFDNSAMGPCEVFGYRRFENLRSSWTVVGAFHWAGTGGQFTVFLPVYGSDCLRAQADDPMCSRSNITLNRIRAVFIDDAFADGGCIQGHDWAIVELEQRISFSARVQPICLPRAGSQKIPEGQQLTVTSWGRRDAFHKSDILIREIPMRHDAECRGRPWADNMPTEVEDYLCAKALNPKDFRTLRTCHGDSGSGMEWRRPGPGASLARTFRQSDNSTTREQSTGAVNGTRQVMHSPLVIPELDFMRKWPNVKAAPGLGSGTPLSLPAAGNGGDEVVRLLDAVGAEAGSATQPKQPPTAERGQCELVGVTSYGSRQCASDELARFTRISHYLEKICALSGICYPLATTI